MHYSDCLIFLGSKTNKNCFILVFFSLKAIASYLVNIFQLFTIIQSNYEHPIIILGLFKSRSFVSILYFGFILVHAKSPTFFPITALNRNEKVKCEDCGKEYRRANAARYRMNYVRGVIFCPERIFCTIHPQ